jgi:hypothetical protein
MLGPRYVTKVRTGAMDDAERGGKGKVRNRGHRERVGEYLRNERGEQDRDNCIVQRRTGSRRDAADGRAEDAEHPGKDQRNQRNEESQIERRGPMRDEELPVLA